MRMYRVHLFGYRSWNWDNQQDFEVGPFTVLFGKNNAGKTNLLEAIYIAITEHEPSAAEAAIRGYVGWATCAVYFKLDEGLPFDDAVLEEVPLWFPVEDGCLRFSVLPPGHVCYATTDGDHPEIWFTDVGECGEPPEKGFILPVPGSEDEYYEVDAQSRSSRGPFPRPLLLGWEFNNVDAWVTSTIADLGHTQWMKTGEHKYLSRDRFLLRVEEDNPLNGWAFNQELQECLDQLTALATDLLPDFLDGSIEAKFSVPTRWGESPIVRLTYCDRRDHEGRALADFGRGTSRWLGIAVQVALRIMEVDPHITKLGRFEKSLSGHVLFLDEPEAHLHPSAVASVVRWCQRMVSAGFNLLAASHHDEFLRISGSEVKFVKVSRQESRTYGDGSTQWWTTARTLTSPATSALQELGDEIGLHPAAALSLHRAILFVEGPLDEAVLDEFAGLELDAAGVTIIPIHGTKNLEGLIDGEFTARLGIKTAVLTDNTNAQTIWDRSNQKRSGEEVKLVRLIKRFEERGLLPPTPFGIPEDDLLFALPPDAIRRFLDTPFPGWQELRDECRAAQGMGPSDSVDWKSYALERYGLPIATADGVRRVIRSLDLAGVELPTIRTVVDEIIAWAS